jgi:hypothetical protein
MTESQVKKNKTKDWSLTSGMHSTPGRHASGAVTADFAPPLLLKFSTFLSLRQVPFRIQQQLLELQRLSNLCQGQANHHDHF